MNKINISDYDLYSLFCEYCEDGSENILDEDGEILVNSQIKILSEKYKIDVEKIIDKFREFYWSDDVYWSVLYLSEKERRKLKLPENISENEKVIMYEFLLYYESLFEKYSIWGN